MQWCGGLAFIYMRWYTKLWTFRRLLRYSLGYVFSGFGVSSSLGWERFFTGQFWPFTWKTSTVGKGKVNKWEFCNLKMTTNVVYVIVIQRIFTGILRVSANALYNCYSRVVELSRVYFHSFMNSDFLLSKGLLCLYDKQNNTWLLLDMAFLFLCSTRHLTRELSS